MNMNFTSLNIGVCFPSHKGRLLTNILNKYYGELYPKEYFSKFIGMKSKMRKLSSVGLLMLLNIVYEDEYMSFTEDCSYAQEVMFSTAFISSIEYGEGRDETVRLLR